MDASITQKQSGIIIYKRLIAYTMLYKFWLTLALIGLVLSALTQPMFAALMKPLIDGTFMDKDPDTIRLMPISILVIFSLRGIANFLSGYFLNKIGRIVVMKLRKALFDKLQHLPIHYYENHPSGDILAQLTYHTEQLAQTSTRGLTILIQDTVIIISLLGLMLYHSWELTLGMLIITPVIALLVHYTTKRFRQLSHHVQNSVSHIAQFASENIQAQREIRIYNGSEFEKSRFEKANQNNLTMHLKHSLIQQISSPIIQFMVAIALAIIIYIATQDSVISHLTPGRFISFIMAMVLLLTPIKRLSQVNAILQSGIAAGEKVFALLDEKIETNQGVKQLKTIQDHITFDNVSFYYPNNPNKQVINSISFTVKKGETIALVGKSGSGKTTLINLLPRFYDYTQGSITIDDQKINEVTLHSLRQQLAYVGQNITLFNDTIRNNIAYGMVAEKQSIKAIQQAAIAAHAHTFIEQLSQGYDTPIGDNGILLSGGQRQRLAIARAILCQAPILILDEATSALDNEAEQHIQKALESLTHKCTTFVVAHRLSTIENADKIIVMDQGCIVETGIHQNLLNKKGLYAHLYHLQFKNE